MKPIVLYSELVSAEVGYSALLKPINHPSELVSNTKLVRTSEVISVNDKGRIETQNTIYEKAKSL